jgi:hypothetical protein
MGTADDRRGMVSEPEVVDFIPLDGSMTAVVMQPDPDVLIGLKHQLVYERERDLLRFRTRNMTNHEIRALMVGLMLRLNEVDRRDVIDELTAYCDPKETPSDVSRAILYMLNRE